MLNRTFSRGALCLRPSTDFLIVPSNGTREAFLALSGKDRSSRQILSLRPPSPFYQCVFSGEILFKLAENPSPCFQKRHGTRGRGIRAVSRIRLFQNGVPHVCLHLPDVDSYPPPLPMSPSTFGYMHSNSPEKETVRSSVGYESQFPCC